MGSVFCSPDPQERSASPLPQAGVPFPPQPHHFLHPVKLRRRPRSHVHMVRNACGGKKKQTNSWLLWGALGCVSSTWPSPCGTETQLRLHDGKPHTNPTPTFISLQFSVVQHKSGAAVSLHDSPPAARRLQSSQKTPELGAWALT